MQLTTPNQATVAALLPQLKSDLARLVAIPSISALGYPAETGAVSGSSSESRILTPAPLEPAVEQGELPAEVELSRA